VGYNFKIFPVKRVTAFDGSEHVRAKMLIDNRVNEQENLTTCGATCRM
jgi:hypothetical protein